MFKNKLNMENIPKHIALIMDGNGRWAKKRFLPRTFGHEKGMERVKEILKAAREINVEYLTVYAFSSENWNRPENEVGFLMKLLSKYIERELEEIHQNNVKLKVLGELDRIPEAVRFKIQDALEKTKNNTGIVFNIALNYGSRQEIIRGIKKLVDEVKTNKLDIENLDEELFESYLYTENQPDPDLIIRTSGEQRISNFLLYQMAYSEFVFTDTLWPDFGKENFFECIYEYQKRDRRFGKV